MTTDNNTMKRDDRIEADKCDLASMARQSDSARAETDHKTNNATQWARQDDSIRSSDTRARKRSTDISRFVAA
jgi:hypothetical protein